MYNDDGSVWEGAVKYDNYPSLSSLRVYFEEGRSDIAGSFDPTFKTITINIPPNVLDTAAILLDSFFIIILGANG